MILTLYGNRVQNHCWHIFLHFYQFLHVGFFYSTNLDYNYIHQVKELIAHISTVIKETVWEAELRASPSSDTTLSQVYQ